MARFSHCKKLKPAYKNFDCSKLGQKGSYKSGIWRRFQILKFKILN